MKPIKTFNKAKEKYEIIRDRLEKTWLIPKITGMINYIWGALKIAFGLFTAHFILCVSGLYSVAIGSSKEVFLIGKKKCGENLEAKRKYYLLICFVLAIASFVYIIYSTRLFFVTTADPYSYFTSFLLIILAFVEVITALIGFRRARKHDDLLMNGLKCVSFVTALSALVFGQIVISPFIFSGSYMSTNNAGVGILCGIGGLAICIYMLTKYFKSNRGKSYL